MTYTPKTKEQMRLNRHRMTLEALMNRIDQVPRDSRPGEQRRSLAAQSEALGVAIRMMQDALTETEDQ